MAGTNRSASSLDAAAGLMPAVILSHPQMGENIGAAARAMKNCGLEKLLLVSPRDGWPNPAAEAMSSGGADVLAGAEVFSSTSEAAASFTMVAATTARKRSMALEVMAPREAAAVICQHNRSGGRAALLFGGERAGLDNDEIAMADMVITVPLNPSFSSLNLGQAVLLMGWECRMAALAGSGGEADEPLPDPASIAEKEFFYAMLEEKLACGGFFASPEMRSVIMRNIKAMFNRSPLSAQDVRTLHGIIKAVGRAGGGQKA